MTRHPDERPVDDPRRTGWRRLEGLLDHLERDGARRLTAAEARETTRLYRAASADLLVELQRDADGAVAEYLRTLVGRAHGMLHRGAPPRVLEAVARFFVSEFPAATRRHVRALLLATLIFVFGGVYGAVAITLDPGAGEVLLVLGNRGIDPHQRVVEAEKKSSESDAPEAALQGTALAGWLFQNNTRVTFLAFALAVTGGVGTGLMVFANGAFLGAVAARYIAAGEGLFLVAWIGPHGVLEIPAVLIGAAAAFVVAKALYAPGLAGRAAALHAAGRDALTLLLGATATLVVAGLIEGTVSQMHEPLVPYPAKIAFAAVVGSAYVAYLALGSPEFLARLRPRRAAKGRS